jgi:rod shape-determining protein MreC
MTRPLRYVPTDRPSRGRDFAILVALLTLALSFATIGQERRIVLSQYVRATALYPFLMLHEAFEKHAVTVSSTRLLASQRDSLAAELASARRVAADVAQLRRLLGLGGLDPGGFILADIVPGRPNIGESHAFLLAKGRLDGVEPPVGVLAGDGIVGVIRSARGSTSIGHFWTHPEFRVSVRTESGSAVGIVRPRQEDDGRMVMELEGMPYQEDVPLGSLLVTSGVSSLYPAGIPVGTVRAVSEVHAGWAKSYLVEPSVRPDEANVALVWRRPAAPE